MKKFLDSLLGRRAPEKEKAPEETPEEIEARRHRELQRLAKLTRTMDLPGLDQGWSKKKKD